MGLCSDGDTLYIPSGSCTWTTTVQDQPALKVDKELIIQGAGIDVTIITDATEPDFKEVMIWSDTDASLRITGMTFKGSAVGDAAGTIVINGDSDGFRIDNMKFLDLPAVV